MRKQLKKDMANNRKEVSDRQFTKDVGIYSASVHRFTAGKDIFLSGFIKTARYFKYTHLNLKTLKLEKH